MYPPPPPPHTHTHTCSCPSTHRTLVKCTPTLLETLVTLSNDDYPLVSNSAHFTISSFSKRYSKDEQNVKLTSLLEERVHSLCSSLPRLMRANDDKRKVATLQLLSGYLRLLGPHVVNLTHSHVHLTRMIQALIQVSKELDQKYCFKQARMFETWSNFFTYKIDLNP